MSQYGQGHYTMTCGRYIKRRNMSGKCLFLPFKVSNFDCVHLKYDFLTPGGPLYLPTKYKNFAQSPFTAAQRYIFIFIDCANMGARRSKTLAADIYISGVLRGLIPCRAWSTENEISIQMILNTWWSKFNFFVIHKRQT